MLIFSLFFIFTLSLFSFSIVILVSRLKFSPPNKSNHHLNQDKKQTQQFSSSPSLHGKREVVDTADRYSHDKAKAQVSGKQDIGIGSDDPAQLTRSILLELLPPDSPKWAELFKDVAAAASCNKTGSVLDGGRDGGDEEGEYEEEVRDTKKKRKKRPGKKKRPDPGSGVGEEQVERKQNNNNNKKEEQLVCLYPFTTSSSSQVQRKLKQNYDQLVKSRDSNALTLTQVGQFVNCLVEAKKELKSRSEVIQRKFTITKALLLKANRSSFDRLHQQIYKLESEQRRLEEDAFIYNWLQQQLKVSSAYKKILEIGACMEMEDKNRQEVERTDDEFADISFEELLAQEKKDAFWQRNGKSRSCSISGRRFC